MCCIESLLSPLVLKLWQRPYIFFKSMSNMTFNVTMSKLWYHVEGLFTRYTLKPRSHALIYTRYVNYTYIIEKGRDLTQSCDKNPYIHRTIQKATWQHKNATKNFDYTTIADRLRTVSWSNSSHPTGVVKPVYGRPTFPLTTTAV